MNEQEKHAASQEERKEKIRARYKGVDRSELEFIPAKQKEKLFEDVGTKRVCAYCRVSTDDANQTSSYELQKNHYEDMIKEHAGWTLVGIYADEGISGTSLQHRDEFNRMIEDCKAGKIDLIVTKSVSRFARNIVDCIAKVRELANMKPQVGVFFETEHIYTLDNTSEMMLAVLSAAAQEESHTKSEIMNISIEQRFSRGIFLTPKLLGYDKDEDGNLVINESEADTVRLCYYLFLSGFPTSEIAEILMDLGRKTKLGNTKWTGSTVVNVLRNERHCGDVLSRKTFTPNYLDHKSKKNNHDRNQYRQTDHHEAIVSREIYNAAQKMLDASKYMKKGYAIKWGTIRNGRWAVLPKSCKGFSEPLYELMGWNKDCKYKLRGQFCGTADEQVMIFELEEPEVLVREKAEEQFAEETEKKPEEAQKPVKKILYPEAWAYNFGESTNRTVFLQRVAYRGNWDILRPARTVEGMEIITREVLDDLLESAEKLIDKMRCANYA